MNKQKRQEYYLDKELTKEEIENSETYLKEKNKKQYLLEKQAKEKNKELKNKIIKELKEIQKTSGGKFIKTMITIDGRGFFTTYKNMGNEVRFFTNKNDFEKTKKYFIQALKELID